jgi:hypothetical protein
MNDWHKEMDDALMTFVTVTELAGEPLKRDEMLIEYLVAPHTPPSTLSAGKMAIYAFWWNDNWLKIGQAGLKSSARYTSQHYNSGSSISNLSKSLISDTRMNDFIGFDTNNPGAWIKMSTCRVNILISARRGRAMLSLLEAFLHVRLKPRYEG